VELHVELVSLALVEEASARVALSITRDLCAPRVRAVRRGPVSQSCVAQLYSIKKFQRARG